MSDGPKLLSVDGGVLESDTKREEAPDWTEVQFPIALFGDRIVIDRDDREELTEGGLILPPNAQDKSMTGMVVAAGPGIQKSDGTNVPMKVAVGDRVVFEKFRRMTELRVNGRNYYQLHANDLLGKVVGDVRVR